jgi:tetratricopeptide (TPR) repeat protein
LLHARSLYAYALIVEGDAELGVSELQALVPQQIELLGPDHIEVKESYARIGNAALSRGDSLTAIDTYREALRIELAGSGTNATSAVGLQRYRLGNALASARRYDAAEADLREAKRILASTLEANHPDIRRADAAIGQLLTRTGRLDEAEAVFRPLLTEPLDQSLDAASIRLRLGTLRSAQGRHGEALQLLQQAAEFFSRQAIPSAYAKALAALGEAQLEARRPSEAADTLKRASSLFENLQPKRSPDHADAMLDLARAHIALGRGDEAVAAAHAAVDFWGRFDPANRSAGIAHLWHARALIAAGRAREARTAMQRAASTLKATALPADRALLAQTQHELHARR